MSFRHFSAVKTLKGKAREGGKWDGSIFLKIGRKNRIDFGDRGSSIN
jgi:hypothetical protein